MAGKTGTRHTIKLDGLQDLEVAFNALEAATRGAALADAAKKGADVIRADAAARAPRLMQADPRREPGLLAREIVAQLGEVTARTAEFLIGPTKRAWYAHFPELGTSKMAAKPYLRPALAAKRKEAEAVFAAEMRARIQAAARG